MKIRIAFLPVALIAWSGMSCAEEDYVTLTPAQHHDMFRAVNAENFDDGGKISHYVWKYFPAFYHVMPIARTAEPRTLQENLRADVAAAPIELAAGEMPLDDYVSTSPLVDGIVVLHKGMIAYEAYPNMKPWDRHYTWSVGKVFASTALAILEAEGRVDMDRPVERYLPELAGTAWSGTTLRNIANMASGIDCRDSDGYQNTDVCIYRFEESLNLTAQVRDIVPPTLDVLRSMERHRPQNEMYEYVSANTHICGLVVERITDRPYWQALQDLIWARIGAEADGFHQVSDSGVPAVHGGLWVRLRDIARFGELFIESAGIGDLLQDHLRDLGSDNGIGFNGDQQRGFASRFPALTEDTPTHAAWQWDRIWPDGAMTKGGYSGQGLYVDPARELVVAWFGTDDEDGNGNELMSAARQLGRSGLFD